MDSWARGPCHEKKMETMMRYFILCAILAGSLATVASAGTLPPPPWSQPIGQKVGFAATGELCMALPSEGKLFNQTWQDQNNTYHFYTTTIHFVQAVVMDL